MHGEVGGGKPAVRGLPCRVGAGGVDGLEHRNTRGIERRSSLGTGGEGGGVHHRRGGERGQGLAQPGRGGGFLQAGNEQAEGAETGGFEAADQGGDARGIGGGGPGTVERDRDQGCVARRSLGQQAGVGVPEAEGRQGLRPRHRARVKPGRQRQLRQRALRGDLSARLAQALQAAQGRDRQGGGRVQRRVGASIGWQDRQRDAPVAGKARDLLHPIGPPRGAADQPDQDAPRMAKGAVDIGVDRKRMGQGRQVRQPQPGQAVPAPPPARRESAEVAVGEGQHHQIRGRLPEVARGVRLFQPVAFAEQDMHQTSAAFTASASRSPFSAMTTSRPCRGCAPHGRSN